MVTRVYQPAYTSPKNTVPVSRKTPGGVTEQQTHRQQVASPDGQADAFTPKRERPDLATLRDQAEGRRIRLDSVLTDFETTLQALGASDQTKRQLQPYITVVRLQGQESKPNIALMKATLLSASKSLDGVIAQATGKPSDVVEQWMQSLLAQDVDYQSVSQPELDQPAQTSPPSSVTLKPGQIKQWVLAAKGQPADTAIPLLHQALAAADQPEVQSRIHALLAKQYWAVEDPTEATHHLAQSVSLQTDEGKQAKQRALLGHWHHCLKQPGQVIDVLQPLLVNKQLDHLPPLTQARVKLDYGMALAANQPEHAIPIMIEGIKQGFAQTDWVKQSLPVLAAAYLATGNTHNALRTLQRLTALERANT
jgi:hypothetical protein